jgi:hypothetical protein
VTLAGGATSVLGLRFAFDETVADRLVVAPNISSQVLDLPIETVPDLLLGLVTRGTLSMVDAELGTSELVALPAGGDVEEASLVWSADDGATPASVDVTPPRSGTSRRVEATQVDGRRSVADVTDVVRSSGPGSYAVAADVDGAWSLLVVTKVAGAPRRLIVAVDTSAQPVGPDRAAAVAVPVAPPGADAERLEGTRPTVLRVVPAGEDLRTVVNGVTLGPPDPSGAYALDIDAAADTLDVTVTATTQRRVGAIGFAIDIVT